MQRVDYNRNDGVLFPHDSTVTSAASITVAGQKSTSHKQLFLLKISFTISWMVLHLITTLMTELLVMTFFLGLGEGRMGRVEYPLRSPK
jgi:hypothetical protein